MLPRQTLRLRNVADLLNIAEKEKEKKTIFTVFIIKRQLNTSIKRQFSAVFSRVDSVQAPRVSSFWDALSSKRRTAGDLVRDTRLIKSQTEVRPRHSGDCVHDHWKVSGSFRVHFDNKFPAASRPTASPR